MESSFVQSPLPFNRLRPVSSSLPSNDMSEKKKVLKILILDDDISVSKSVALLIKVLGHMSIQCSDSNEALKLLSKEFFDLLIIDYRLEGPTGIEVVRNLRKNNIHMPIIMMSGFVKWINPTDVQELRINSVLTKPFGLDILDMALSTSSKKISV